MAYEKQTWQTGDIITAEKLNHIEDGIGENMIVITAVVELASGSTGTITLDKTYNEIVNGDFPMLLRFVDEKTGAPRYIDFCIGSVLNGINPQTGEYGVMFSADVNGSSISPIYDKMFICNSVNDYPKVTFIND